MEAVDDIDIIADRICLLADVLQQTPVGYRELLSALSRAEARELCVLLNKLTDKAEEIFCKSERKDPPGAVDPPEAELGERELLCCGCELFCRVSWSEAGEIEGAKCQCGYEEARRQIKNSESK